MASSSKAASGPSTTLTRSRSTSSWHLVLAPAGLPPVSATTSSTLRLPKLLFFCFRNVCTPCSIWMPPCASGPVLTVSRPSLNGAPCAIAGIGKLNVAAAAPAAVPAINARRVTFRDIAFLLGCFDGAAAGLDRPYELCGPFRVEALVSPAGSSLRKNPSLAKAFHDVKPARSRRGDAVQHLSHRGCA